jgi:hypothetical protein
MSPALSLVPEEEMTTEALAQGISDVLAANREEIDRLRRALFAVGTLTGQLRQDVDDGATQATIAAALEYIRNRAHDALEQR